MWRSTILIDKQDTMREPIQHKETLLKLNEPLKLKALPFAKGYRIEVTLNIDPNNPLHLDSILLPLEKSTVRLAVQAFKQNIIEKDLGGRLIEDEPREVHPEPTLDSKNEGM